MGDFSKTNKIRWSVDSNTSTTTLQHKKEKKCEGLGSGDVLERDKGDCCSIF
jgi:hypothetical protein